MEQKSFYFGAPLLGAGSKKLGCKKYFVERKNVFFVASNGAKVLLFWSAPPCEQAGSLVLIDVDSFRLQNTRKKDLPHLVSEVFKVQRHVVCLFSLPFSLLLLFKSSCCLFPLLLRFYVVSCLLSLLKTSCCWFLSLLWFYLFSFIVV